MLILGIDSSEKKIRLAISDDIELIEEITVAESKTEELITYLDQLLIRNNIRKNDIQAIGVITGPGTYTGTRSGVAVAKTLAQFLEIPVYGYNKLEAIARTFSSQNFVPMIDVKRNEIYFSIVKSNKEPEYIYPARLLTVSEFISFINQEDSELLLLASDFINKQELFSSLNPKVKTDFFYQLNAFDINKLVWQDLNNNLPGDYTQLSPFYIRDAI